MDRESHAALRVFYKALLQLRRDEPALGNHDWNQMEIAAADENGIVMRRSATDAGTLVVVVCFRAPAVIDLSTWNIADGEVIFSTEEPRFALDPQRIEVDSSGATVHFQRAGAAILRHAAATP